MISTSEKRWVKWIVAMGYPFNFTFDIIPDLDMLDAIAQEWVDIGEWPTFDEARFDVYDEVGILDQLNFYNKEK
jgi:hypothetical protein